MWAMSPFVPPEPPFVPEPAEDAPALDVPRPAPEVGFGSPWRKADAQNRDEILDYWRAWFERVFFPWIRAWTAYWAAQWQAIADYLNVWLAAAGDYITLHAVNGYSWHTTVTPIATSGATNVTIVTDQYRPLLVGDLVSDQTVETVYGIITVVIDATHATVAYRGQLRGADGADGPQGTPGLGEGGYGLPLGGDTGDALVKHSATDGDAEWTPISLASHSVPPGGTTRQVLGKINGTDYNYDWLTVPTVPPEGTIGQFLAKVGAGDFDYDWRPPVASGGQIGSVYTKQSNSEGDTDWSQPLALVVPVITPTAGDDTGSFDIGYLSGLLNLATVPGGGRLRLYTTTTARSEDSSRPIGTAPAVRGVCLAEIIGETGGVLNPDYNCEATQLITDAAHTGSIYWHAESDAWSSGDTYTLTIYGQNAVS